MPYTHASSSSSSAATRPLTSPHAPSGTSSSSDVSDDNPQINWVSLVQRHFPYISAPERTNIAYKNAYEKIVAFLLKKADAQDERTSQLKNLITDVPQILDKNQQTKLVELIVDLIKMNSTSPLFLDTFTIRLHHCLPAELASRLYEYAIQQHSPLTPIDWAIICNHPLSDSIASHIKDTSAIGPLHFASKLKKPELVSTLLRLKAEVDHIINGRTASMFACVLDLVEILRSLHQAGADLNIVTEEHGSTLLHIAASNGSIATANYLLENNSKLINSKNKQGNPPLKAALDNKQFKIAERLVDQTEDLPNNGFILLNATVAGSIKLVEALLRKGFPADFKDKNGKNALHFAVLRGHEHIVKLLVKRAPKLITEMDNSGNTALHYATVKPSLEIVTTILDEIDKDTIVQNSKGATPTHIAAQNMNVKILEFLLNKTPQWTHAGNDLSQSPLHFAVIKNNIETFKLLVKSTPELMPLQDRHGLTALHYAARWNMHEIAIILMQHAPNLADVISEQNQSPLDVAAQFDCIETARAILEIKPKRANIATHNGVTALHIAASRDNVRVAEFLLKTAPALASAKDNQGNTPAHIVVNFNASKVAKLLIEKDISLFSKVNNNYKTAYQLTIINTKQNTGLDIFKLILKYHGQSSSPLAAFGEGFCSDAALLLALREKNYRVLDLFFQYGAFISPGCCEEFGSNMGNEINRRIEKNAEVYRQPRYKGDRIGTLAGLALKMCREQCMIDDTDIRQDDLDKLDGLLLMPMGYTDIGEWFIPKAMAGDPRYLERLEKSQKEPLALARWFAQAPNGCGYDHLAIKLVTYRASKNKLINEPIELTDEEISTLLAGQTDSLQSLLQKYPSEQLKIWLNALIKEPETAKFHESYQTCLAALDKSDLIARLLVLKEQRLARQSKHQQVEEQSRTPQFFQAGQSIRLKRLSPEEPSSDVGPVLKLQRIVQEEEQADIGELFSYASPTSSSSSNEERVVSFDCSSDEQNFISEVINSSSEHVVVHRGQTLFQPKSSGASSSVPVSDDSSCSLASLN